MVGENGGTYGPSSISQTNDPIIFRGYWKVTVAGAGPMFGGGSCDILINGNSYACGNISPITGGSATITYTINSTLQQFMTDNPDVTVTYQNHMECENPPANVYDSAVTSFTNGATAVLTRNCSTGDALVTIELTISTPTNRELFYETCCVPYSYPCGSITSLTAYFSFNLEA